MPDSSVKIRSRLFPAAPAGGSGAASWTSVIEPAVKLGESQLDVLQFELERLAAANSNVATWTFQLKRYLDCLPHSGSGSDPLSVVIGTGVTIVLPVLLNVQAEDALSLKVLMKAEGDGTIQCRRVKSITLRPDLQQTAIEVQGPPLADCRAEVSVHADLDLPLNRAFLTDLIGESTGIRISLNVADEECLRFPVQSGATPVRIPYELHFKFPAIGSESSCTLSLMLWMKLSIPGFDPAQDIAELTTARLQENRLYFFLPRSGDEQLLDLDAFAVELKPRASIPGPASEENHDGYFDLEKRELVFDLRAPAPEKAATLNVYFPGGLEELFRDVRASEGDARAAAIVRRDEALAKRFSMPLRKLWPEKFPLEPETDPDYFYLRLREQGISFSATLAQKDVEVEKDKPGQSRLVRPFALKPQPKRGDLESRIVVIDNQIRVAAIYATTQVPGLKDMRVDVDVSLRTAGPGRPPQVVAEMVVSREKAAVYELEMGMLTATLERLALSLRWLPRTGEWEYTARADASLGFTAGLLLPAELTDLLDPTAIQLTDLDLRNLNFRSLSLPLKLKKPVHFEILSGSFGIEMHDLSLTWKFDGKGPVPQVLRSGDIRVAFRQQGALQLTLGATGLDIPLAGGARIAFPSRLAVQAILGSAVAFDGEMGWVEEAGEKYFLAAGLLGLEGFPRVQALFKIGTGTKDNGQKALQVVLFGAMDMDVSLFSAVVVKTLGVGVGINNRLRAVSTEPTVRQILDRIDQMEPGKESSWGFVREDGLYVSIVAKCVLASNPGARQLISSYVLQLVASVDTNLQVAAGAKLWLSTSVDGATKNPLNPALVGALTLSPRTRTLSIALETRPKPYVESNKQLEKMLSSARARLSIRVSPQLVDYHLEELSYQDVLLSAPTQFTGSLRVAIFQRQALFRAQLAATSSIQRTFDMGAGGASLSGELDLSMGFAGLISEAGLAGYAEVAVSLAMQASAWLEVGFSKSFKLFRKRITISWKVRFTMSTPRLSIHLLGTIAVDESGNIGIKGGISADLSVGGYPLRVAAELAIRPEICEQVKARVAAFERQLDAAGAPAISGVTAFKRQPDATGAPAISGDAPGAGDQEPETWVWHRCDRSSLATLLPRAGGRWLTPRHASVESITGTDRVFTVRTTNHALDFKSAPFIRLIGPRLDPTMLERRWRVIPPAGGDQLNEFSLEVPGGTVIQDVQTAQSWAVDPGDGRIASPQLLEDVERIAVASTDELFVTSLAGWVLTLETPPIQESVLLDRTRRRHVVLLSSGGTVLEPARAGPQEKHSLGWEVASCAETTLTLKEIDGLTGPPAGVKTVKPVLVEVWTPWNVGNQATFDPKLTNPQDPEPEQKQLQERLALIGASFLESARDSSQGSKSTSTQSYELVQDPRVCNLSRAFWPRADAFAPDHAPPPEFRRLVDIDPVAVTTGELLAIQRFELAVDRARRSRRHHGAHRDDAAQHDAVRATLVQTLLDELSAPGGASTYQPVASASDPNQVLGILFPVPLKTGGVFIRRSGRPATAVTALPSDCADAAALIFPQFPRQKYQILNDGAVEDARLAVYLPVRLDPSLLNERAASLTHFQIYRRFEWETNPVLIADGVRPTFSFVDEAEGVRPVATSDGTAVIGAAAVMNPYLFTDTFDVKGRAFTDPVLVAQGLRPDVTRVFYSARLAPPGEVSFLDTTKTERSRFIEWPGIPLHIPPPSSFPADLSMVVGVDELSEPAETKVKLQVISSTGRRHAVFESDDKPPFQLWVRSDPLQLEGFYAGGGMPDAVGTPDSGTADLTKVARGRTLLSTCGMVRLNVQRAASGPAHWMFDRASLEPRCRHTFYIAPLLPGAVGANAQSVPNSPLVMPLPVALARRLPTAWSDDLPLRSADHLELIDRAAALAFSTRQPHALPRDRFDIDDVFHLDQLNALRVTWHTESVLHGGVELVFRDLDESTRESRQLCEVMESEVYTASRRDLSEASTWDLELRERMERVSLRSRPVKPLKPNELAPPKEMRSYFHGATKNEGSDKPTDAGLLLKALYTAADRVLTTVQSASTSWPSVYDDTRKFLVAAHKFRTSPVCFEEVAIEQPIEAIGDLVRALLVGIRPPAKDTSAGSMSSQIRKQLVDLRPVLENAVAPAASKATETDAVRFADSQLAAGLVGSLRRRLAVVEDLFALELLVRDPTAPPAGERRPRQQQWDDLQKTWIPGDQPAPVLPRSQPLLDAIVPRAAEPGYALALEPITKSLRQAIDASVENRAKTLPLAAGLSQALDAYGDALNKAPGKHRVLKRMHHTVAARTGDGNLAPEPTPLSALLPDDARVQAPGALPPLPSPRFEEPGTRVNRVAIARDSEVQIWTVPKNGVPQLLQRITAAGSVRSVDLFAAPGRQLVLVGREHGTDVFDALSGTWLKSLPVTGAAFVRGGPGPIRVLGLHAEAATSNQPSWRKPQLLDVETGQLLASYEPESETADPIVLTHDPECGLVFGANACGRLLVWGLAAGGKPTQVLDLTQLTPPFNGTIQELRIVSLSAGRLLLALTSKGPVWWRISPAGDLAVEMIDALPSSTTGVAFAPRSQSLAALDPELKQVLVWATFRQGTPVKIPIGGSLPSSLCFLAGDPPRVLLIFDNGPAKVFELRGTRLEDWPATAAGGIARTLVMPAVAASTSRGVVSYLNLLERMGFAVDVAVAGPDEQLLRQAALKKSLLDALPSAPVDCRTLLVLPQEPDGRGNEAGSIGFSFLKVAVAPDLFVRACLAIAPLFDGPFNQLGNQANETSACYVLEGDQKGQCVLLKGNARDFGSARVLVVDLEMVNPLAEWLAFRGIQVAFAPAADETPEQQALRTAGMIQLLHVAELSRYVWQAAEAGPAWPTLRLEPRGDRWLTVPARAKRSQSLWPIPDRKGHRIRVAVRQVSRYEPLLRWASQDNEPLTPPHLVPILTGYLAADAAQGTATVELDKAVPSPLPRFVEITSGQGRGQRRGVLAANGRRLNVDPGDPWVVGLKSRDGYRLVAESDDWACCDLEPVVDLAQHEGDRPLVVHSFPHATDVLFSYQLPPAAGRALANRISNVRTGFSGTELTFRYDTIDRTPSLQQVLGNVSPPQLADPGEPDLVWALPTSLQGQLRLFSNERLVRLRDLPFFYEYRLDARSLVAGRTLLTDEQGAAEMLTPLSASRPNARRVPSQLGVRRAAIEVKTKSEPSIVNATFKSATLLKLSMPVTTDGRFEPIGRIIATGDGRKHTSNVTSLRAVEGGVEATLAKPVDAPVPGNTTIWKATLLSAAYTVVLPLSLSRDHLTIAERSGVESLPFTWSAGGQNHTALVEWLPDFVMDYALYWALPVEPTVADSRMTDDHLAVGRISMPWSPSHIGTDPEPTLTLDAPDLELVRPKLVIEPVPNQSGQTVGFQLRVSFRVKTKPGPYGFFLDPDRYRLQASRQGQPLPALIPRRIPQEDDQP